MLAVIALQGAGLPRALHLAIEHAPRSRIDCGCGKHDHSRHEPDRTSGEAALSPDDGPRSGPRDPAHCAVCQTLASLKAVSTVPGAGLWGSLPASVVTAWPDSFPLALQALTTLGPRAPPALA